MTVSLHLMKLCVGCDSPAELAEWQRDRWQDRPARHVTRMWPKREDELLQGGSLYWVFKGVMSARQRLIGLEERIGEDGIRRCALMLDPELIRVTAVPRRPFQGWRYLNGAEAPIDLPRGAVDDTPLPPEVAARLAEMGLI